MTVLDRTEISAGFLAELDDFGELLRSLSPADLDAPTRCTGWTVRDVAGHMVGQVTDVVNGRLEGLGTPEVTEREAKERAGRSAEELADEIAEGRAGVAALAEQLDDAAWNAPVGTDFDGTVGDGVLALWFDGYLHADDIRAALGTPSVQGDGLRGSLHWVAADLGRRGWGPATLALDGIEVIEVSGGGEKIAGDPVQFLLVATGRADPSPHGLDESVNIFG
jgi:uncharacterized protein (TIGR03083 family)